MQTTGLADLAGCALTRGGYISQAQFLFSADFGRALCRLVIKTGGRRAAGRVIRLTPLRTTPSYVSSNFALACKTLASQASGKRRGCSAPGSGSQTRVVARIDSLRSAKGYLAILRSLLQSTPSGRGYYSALLDAIAAQARPKNARAAPRGLHKAAGPLPGHNTNKSKTLGPPSRPETTNCRRLLGGAVVSTAMARP